LVSVMHVHGEVYLRKARGIFRLQTSDFELPTSPFTLQTYLTPNAKGQRENTQWSTKHYTALEVIKIVLTSSRIDLCINYIFMLLFY
jgi:hypothetical protein